jgi:hypothetical protein
MSIKIKNAEKEEKVKIAQWISNIYTREKFAAFLMEVIEPTHIGTDYVSMLLDTRELQVGDVLQKRIRKGMEVRTLVPGAVHLASEITLEDRIMYMLDGVDIKVTANHWELESGDLGTAQSIQTEMVEKIRDEYVNRVFTALSTVWSAANTPNNFVNVGGALTDTVLKAAIDRINQSVGSTKAVIGTREVLTPVTTFGGFWQGTGTDWTEIPSKIQEIADTGFLGMYYGAPIVAVQQKYDWPDTQNALLPSDKALVIGEGVGEFITYGGIRNKEYTDMKPTPPQWFFELYQQFGLIIDNAEGIYVIGGLS